MRFLSSRFLHLLASYVAGALTIAGVAVLAGLARLAGMPVRPVAIAAVVVAAALAVPVSIATERRLANWASRRSVAIVRFASAVSGNSIRLELPVVGAYVHATAAAIAVCLVPVGLKATGETVMVSGVAVSYSIPTDPL